MKKNRLVVIGGGAAGFFCAVNAARLNPALEVVILERSNKLLSKVKVSGGGRCNVTHACYSIAEMIKKYPRGSSFLKKAFHHFFTADTIAWFSERGVALKAEADGRMFPVSDDSQTIIDCLMREANKYAVDILMNREVKGINKMASGWDLLMIDETVLSANFVCIASGGYPKISQYSWLSNSEHEVEEPVPSLFTFNLPGNAVTALMGVAVENAQVKIPGSKFSESGPLLITHWGMSGPAVLKLSAWAARELWERRYEFAILVNWIPEFNENSLREKMQKLRFELAAQKIANRNPFGLPNRLWEYLLAQSGVHPDGRWADLPAKEQNKLIRNLCANEYFVKGKTTFKEEFVTAGGIQLTDIDFNTMESKKHSGLYFAGEVINVDGITGGYNFQNAWTTGWIAAKAISSLEA
ncbi:MAG: NAD(P)/FAD-dependent oxidoreductase [Chitinophagaceae bacterium]|nr:NAD(P)/FAD-dependent oxidoreductase [Chitinophagaceae bacterium]